MQLMHITVSEKPFFSFREHSHPFWEIIRIDEGEGEEIINGVSHKVHEGSIIGLPAGIPHASRSETGLRDSCAMIKDFPSDINSRLMFLEDDKNSSIHSLLHMLFDAVVQSPHNAAALIEATMNLLYQRLLAAYPNSKEENPAIAALKSTIIANLSNIDFRLDLAIKETGFSSGYIRSLFRKETGYPPLAWMTCQRIKSAQNILLNYPGQYTIRQVCFMVGFNDPYYFSRQFKRVIGISPSDYILQITEQPLPNPNARKIQPDT